MKQQYSKSGSAQTILQQLPSAQPAVACSAKQLPLTTWPQPPSQVTDAASTQDESQRTSQQNGSKRQTASQHAGSLQLGEVCGTRQLPAQLSPQPGTPQHVNRAMVAQPASQLCVQHSGSTWQTPAQQTSSSQPAVSACDSKQLPLQGQSHEASGTQLFLARLTQVVFHCTSQQSGSTEQTTEQHVASEQPGLRCDLLQGSAPGQSP